MSDVSKTNDLTTDPRLTGGYQLGVNDVPALVAQIDHLEMVAARLSQRNEDTMNLLYRTEAERDAALAAIKRVQETLSLHNPNGRLVKEVLAALDGAPEPETPELFSGTNAALDRLTVRKADDANAFCIEHGNFHAVELGDPTCEFEDGFGSR